MQTNRRGFFSGCISLGLVFICLATMALNRTNTAQKRVESLKAIQVRECEIPENTKILTIVGVAQQDEEKVFIVLNPETKALYWFKLKDGYVVLIPLTEQELEDLLK